jgi:hypothetical protein
VKSPQGIPEADRCNQDEGNKLIDMDSRGTGAVAGQESKWWTPRLAGPVIAAAAVRLVLMAVSLTRNGIGVLSLADTSSYLIPGRNVLLHGSFVADGVPDLFRTPGYPLFLAITSLAGLRAGAAANMVLSVFCVLLVWKLGWAVFEDDRIALGAAWVFAFEPISVSYSFVLMSEFLFLTLFLLSMERVAEFLRGRRLGVLAVAALWLAAATLVRPVTYYLPWALALGLSLVLARAPGLRWKAPAVLLITVLPWLAAWQIRNKIETGYGALSSTADVFFYVYTEPDVIARAEHRSFVEVRKELGNFTFQNRSGQVYLYPAYVASHPDQAGWSQSQRLAFMHSQAVAAIRTHFAAYLRSCVQAVVKAAFDPGAGYFDQLLIPEDKRVTPFAGGNAGPIGWGITLAKKHPWVALEKGAFLAVLLGLYLFAIRGVFLATQGAYGGNVHSACVWLLLGTTLYFFAVSAAPGGAGVEARYRIAIMPVVCIFAAAGFRRTKPVAR